MIALPSQQVTIDNETYTIVTLDGVTCSNLFFKLLAAAGAAFSKLQALSGDKDDLAIRALGALLAGLSPELSAEVRTVFAGSCTVTKEGKELSLKVVFPVHFAGRMAHMGKWILECAKVNFADFLDDGSAEGILEQLRALAS